MLPLPGQKSERILWMIMFAAAWLAGLNLSVWDQDESAYAAFALRMIETGNWLIPEFLWSDIHRKPPLHFWSIALSYQLFGVHEWAVRLPALLALFGTVLLVRFRTVQVFGLDTARTAAWILAANLFLPHLAKIAVTDALLLFFETLAVTALINHFQKPGSKEKGWFVLGTAGALLVKGPPILILTFGMLGLILLFSPERKKIIGFHPWLLFPLAAMPLLVWGRLAWLTDDGEFIRWMIDWYTFRRISSDVLGQTGPPGYYLLTFLIGFLPFVPVMLKGFRELIKHYHWRKPEFRHFMLLAWLISGWVIYEFMSSKLPAYALGAYPALALLLGRQFNKLQTRAFRNEWSLKGGLMLYGLLGLGMAVALPLAAAAPVGNGRLFSENGVLFARFMGLGMGIFTLSVVVLLLRSQFQGAFRAMLGQSVFFVLVGWLLLLPDIEPLRSATKQLAEKTAELPSNTQVVVISDYHLPSLPYYMQLQKRSLLRDNEPENRLEHLKNPAMALIANSKHLGEIQQIAAEAGLKLEIIAEIDGWISDKGQFTTWYLLQGGSPQLIPGMESDAE
jgi:4-amino-4-deoxy-L-arabinose transferase-like glycosyltransferase